MDDRFLDSVERVGVMPVNLAIRVRPVRVGSFDVDQHAIIIASRRSRCASCGDPVLPGKSVEYFPDRKAVIHVTCDPPWERGFYFVRVRRPRGCRESFTATARCARCDLEIISGSWILYMPGVGWAWHHDCATVGHDAGALHSPLSKVYPDEFEVPRRPRKKTAA